MYFAVDDIDATAAKIKELGGTTMMEPFEAGDVGKLVVAGRTAGRGSCRGSR